MAGTAFSQLSDVGEALSVSLRDGAKVTIRPCNERDEPALADFLAGLCLNARRLRFFTGAVNIDQAAHLTAATGTDRLGLLAVDDADELVGHAVCIELAPGRAEVAVEVADRLHGQGLGTILVERLAEVAERHGISTFCAQVLPDNGEMLAVFRAGFDAQVAWDDGVEAVEFPTAAWRLARQRYGQ
jgi:GNAT superfamily N-acetyltransferase